MRDNMRNKHVHNNSCSPEQTLNLTYDQVIAANRQQQDRITSLHKKIESLVDDGEELIRKYKILSKAWDQQRDMIKDRDDQIAKLKQEHANFKSVLYKPCACSSELAKYKQAVVNDATLLGHKDKMIFQLQSDVEQYKAVVTKLRNERQDVHNSIDSQHAIIKRRLNEVLKGL
jgi:chromosome segregation ATPase